jgi:hypothetical protein
LAQPLRLARPALIALQEVTPDQLAYLQGELSEFASLTVPVVDHDPAMTAVGLAQYGRCGLAAPPSPYEAVCFLDVTRFIAERQLVARLTPQQFC